MSLAERSKRKQASLLYMTKHPVNFSAIDHESTATYDNLHRAPTDKKIYGYRCSFWMKCFRDVLKVQQRKCTSYFAVTVHLSHVARSFFVGIIPLVEHKNATGAL